jgi:glyoxylase-like metal-dependent hydrolase (beta-lactamase superfamily II)/rhodanese-related sulfurtransferase
MKIVPFVHEGLGNSSYLVGLSDNSALMIDPDRSVQRYLDAASERGWRIDAVLETHLHADFVTGAHEIAAALGARLLVPRDAHSRLSHEPVDGAQRFTFDGVEIEAVGSPGHTPEHTSYVARTASHPPALFSGGSLIVGGAARTDLISPDMTDTLSRAQFRTLKTAFGALPDETWLYPTHGGGSFCSAGSGSTRTSTLGAERASNPLLAFDSEDEFAASFPTTFPSVPAYYSRMRAFNQAGPRLRRDIQPPPALSPVDFAAARADAVVIDARPMDAYATSHISHSISIAFRDVFAVWLGWLVPANARLLFLTGDTPLQRVVDESLLVGYEQFAGVLEGGLRAWEDAGLPVASARIVGAAEARRSLLDGATALDVREPDEYSSGHIPDAIHVPLGELAERADEIPRDRPVVAYCGHGERGATAVSLLERAGRTALLNLDGGLDAWRDAGFSIAT